jgi:hypothetical protein
MDLLEFGSRWLDAQRHTHLTREIMYRRGIHSVTLRATVGRTQFELSDGLGTVLETQVRDYLIRAQDLVLNGRPTLPERGDRIEEAQDQLTFIYEVLPLGDEPAWRYSDPYRQTFRIHTRQVDLEE